MDCYVQIQHVCSNCVILGLMLFFGCLRCVLSQTGDHCILDISVSPQINSSGCPASGTWGDFLSHKCCEAVFDEYLLGLAIRANQTGQIYLNLAQQKSCLISLKGIQTDILNCGIEKLTKGAGECSEYSVQDVKNVFEEELKDLAEDCKLSHTGSCSSCLNRWTHMNEMPNENGASEQDRFIICRFSVLVTLISTRVEDQDWFYRVHECLAQQNVTYTGAALALNRFPWNI